MENQAVIACIIRGMEHYLETLALPPHMEHYDDGVCAWIKPRAGQAGPACVYKVNFGDRPEAEVARLIQAYRAGGAPDPWFVTPLSTPGYVRDLLSGLGLMDDAHADMHDQGMAIPPVQSGKGMPAMD